VATVKASIRSSNLWRYFQSFKLETNHRLEADDLQYAQWLLDLGNGVLPTTALLSPDTIKLPTDIISENIANDIFLNRILPDEVYGLKDQAILCPKNQQCDSINTEIINRIEGRLETYYSVDSVVSDDDETENLFPPEFLHTCYSSGLPHHELSLKVGCLIILLRNLNGRWVKTSMLQ